MHGTQILFLLLEMMSQEINRQGEAQASELEDGRIRNELCKTWRHLWVDTDFYTWTSSPPPTNTHTFSHLKNFRLHFEGQRGFPCNSIIIQLLGKPLQVHVSLIHTKFSWGHYEETLGHTYPRVCMLYLYALFCSVPNIKEGKQPPSTEWLQLFHLQSLKFSWRKMKGYYRID